MVAHGVLRRACRGAATRKTAGKEATFQAARRTSRRKLSNLPPREASHSLVNAGDLRNGGELPGQHQVAAIAFRSVTFMRIAASASLSFQTPTPRFQ